MLKSRTERKHKQIKTAREELLEKANQEGTLSILDEQDIEFMATTKVKLTQKDILKMYVGNWASLDLKQRRKVMGFIQAQRSKHAKEIFLKELALLGRKMHHQKEALLANNRVENKKDPLKLKLESITA